MDFKTINPFLLAMIQFAVLGSFGEVVALIIKKEKIKVFRFLYSAVVWSVLGVLIKFVFTGFSGFVYELVKNGIVPDNLFIKSFLKSFFTNWLFGPWLIIIHRVLDSIILGKVDLSWQKLKKSMFSLVWFWLGAHTVTFMLSPQWQMTLAAAWSFVLGLLLSIFSSKDKTAGKNGSNT